ncbi:MAG: 7TM diverse intracellular signaling domain-containing protein, partial [Flavobacteriaceae bacterium]
MMARLYHIAVYLLFVNWLSGQEVYDIDPQYPVHDLNRHLQVIVDSTDQLSVEYLLRDSTLQFTKGDKLPRLLNSNMIYWGKLRLKALDSLLDWTLHFEDKMIGPPAWTKSNGKVDVYAYVGSELIFHQKTGVEYSKKERSTDNNWVLNSINLHELPVNTPVTLIIKAQGNSFGYPAYFNLSARSPEQPYYHQIYQFNNSFNTFMFGVTFIIFLFFLLQFIYLKESIYFWFSLWLFFCTLTQAMTNGLIIGALPAIRFPLWMFIANGIFFTFWFFGRSFIESKRKFPK